MSTVIPVSILVTISGIATPVPTGSVSPVLNVTVTDASGAIQTLPATVSGITATATFSVAPGAGSVSAASFDAAGVALGTAVVQPYNTGVVGGVTFLQPTSIQVSLA
jgi:hypothetical protein